MAPSFETYDFDRLGPVHPDDTHKVAEDIATTYGEEQLTHLIETVYTVQFGILPDQERVIQTYADAFMNTFDDVSESLQETYNEHPEFVVGAELIASQQSTSREGDVGNEIAVSEEQYEAIQALAAEYEETIENRN